MGFGYMYDNIDDPVGNVTYTLETVGGEAKWRVSAWRMCDEHNTLRVAYSADKKIAFIRGYRIRAMLHGFPVIYFMECFSAVTDCEVADKLLGNCDEVVLDLSEVDLTNAINLWSMLKDNRYITRIKWGNTPMEHVQIDGIVQGCKELRSLDLSQFRYKYGTSTGREFNRYFNTANGCNGCTSLKEVNLGEIPFTCCGESMFKGCRSLEKIEWQSGEIDRNNDKDVMDVITTRSYKSLIKKSGVWRVWHMENHPGEWPLSWLSDIANARGTLPKIVVTRKKDIQKAIGNPFHEYHEVFKEYDMLECETVPKDDELVSIAKKVTAIKNKTGIMVAVKGTIGRKRLRKGLWELTM